MSRLDPEFEQFFGANYDALVRSLTAITGDKEVASDCVQEAFVKASGRWRKVKRLDNPATWVRRVAINRSRDIHRSNKRRQEREKRVNDKGQLMVNDSTSEIVGSLSLAQLLQQLPAQQRATSSLFYIEDLSISEIAAALKISEGAVKFHLNKARSALKNVLEERHYRYG